MQTKQTTKFSNKSHRKQNATQTLGNWNNFELVLLHPLEVALAFDAVASLLGWSFRIGKPWHVSSASRMDKFGSWHDFDIWECGYSWVSEKLPKGASSWKADLLSFSSGFPQALACKETSDNKPPILKLVKLSSHGDRNCARPASVVRLSNLLWLESKDASDNNPPMLISLESRKICCKEDSFSGFVLGLFIFCSKDASDSRAPMLISDISPTCFVPDLFTDLGSDPLIFPCNDISDRRPPMLKLVKVSSQGTVEYMGTTSVASSPS